MVQNQKDKIGRIYGSNRLWAGCEMHIYIFRKFPKKKKKLRWSLDSCSRKLIKMVFRNRIWLCVLVSSGLEENLDVYSLDNSSGVLRFENCR
jgi:hypothetical protein